jgi:hypothetical protein
MNPFVSDYPRITVQTKPARMEIVYNSSGETKRYTEDIKSEDITNKFNQNMDEVHYSKLNEKTTPYVVKESSSDAGSNANSYGYSNSEELSVNSALNFAYTSAFSGGASSGFTQKTSKSENFSFSNSFSNSSMSERTVFQDVNYRDNMDSKGVSLNEAKVKEMANKFRQSDVSSENISYSANAGLVDTCVTFKNETLNMPVKISNVRCSVMLKKHSGELEPLQDNFLLKDRDGYPFELEIGGGDQSSEYAIMVEGLNTFKIINAIKNGYVPVISIFSYDMTTVADSYYQPGVKNLKQIEEAAKGRTALIKISAPKMRKLYRVTAFDQDQIGAFVPGISLKKALFKIFRSPLRGGESYVADVEGKPLTVLPVGQWWSNEYAGNNTGLRHEYIFNNQNLSGNDWDYFATEVKSYTDEFNNIKRIETIKRIGNDRDAFGNYINAKYNPFKDNPNYDEGIPLSEAELLKTKYWVIMHNGKFFEGDINDPIWPGDRFEIIFYSIEDFKNHYENYVFTPLQSGDILAFDTRWNSKLNLSSELARSKKLGVVMKGDLIRLDVWLKESRFLFDQMQDSDTGPGIPYPLVQGDANSPKAWWDFKYTFEPSVKAPNGIPQCFTHSAYGGVNSIKVRIEASRYAHCYIIKLLNMNETNGVARQIRISAEDLEKNRGEVYLNSRTIDANGFILGNIQGSNYKVTVFAHGLDFNHPVTTSSGSNFDISSETRVSDAIGQIPNMSFNFSVQNLYRNNLFVRLPEWPNTEYFLIRCTGPFNYGMGTQVKEIIGHEGLNIIDIDHPFQGISEAFDPGVYEVRVFAVNRNQYNSSGEIITPLEASESRLGAVVSNVEYFQYQQQRVVAPYKYLPESELAYDSSATVRSFDMNAIDLEVNFNEGSGWWRLKLANDDRGPRFVSALRREIDCRFTSIVEDQRTQHFAIYFKPPAGEQNPFLNVFRSSDNNVDLYIRTVAENKYRDTFWMKKFSMSQQFESGINSIVTPSTVGNFIDYWNKLEGTDASRFEESLNSWRINSYENYNGNTGLYENVTNSSNYFFSPLEQRKYYISAKFAEQTEYVFSVPTMLDFPRYTALPGPGLIYLNNIDSRYADSYEVWWRRFDRTGIYTLPLNFEFIGWNGTKILPDETQMSYWNGPAFAEPDENGACNFQIPNLDGNQHYVVAVVGKNASFFGTSNARFTHDINTSGDRIGFVTPYPSVAPAAAPSVNVQVNGRTINLSNIYLAEQCRYIIRWCEVVGGVERTWSSYDTYKDNGKFISFAPMSYSINGLNPLSNYKIQVCAITLNDQKGPNYDQTWITGSEGEINVSQSSLGKTTYMNTAPGYNCWCKDVDVFINSTLPPGTAEYEIRTNTSYTQITSWLCTPSQHTRISNSPRLPASQTQYLMFTLTRGWTLPVVANCYNYANFTTNYTIICYNSNGVEIMRKTDSIPSYPIDQSM